nr:hypothetical protein [Brucella intermedia]
MRKTTGIKISNSSNIRIQGGKIEGCDIGIDADNVEGLEVDGVEIVHGNHRFFLTDEEVEAVRAIIASAKSKDEAINSIARLDKFVLWARGNAIDLIALALSAWSTFKP